MRVRVRGGVGVRVRGGVRVGVRVGAGAGAGVKVHTFMRLGKKKKRNQLRFSRKRLVSAMQPGYLVGG